jgi:hypothetical protein
LPVVAEAPAFTEPAVPAETPAEAPPLFCAPPGSALRHKDETMIACNKIFDFMVIFSLDVLQRNYPPTSNEYLKKPETIG